MAKQTKTDPAAADAMASTLFSSFTKAAPAPVVDAPAAQASPALPHPASADREAAAGPAARTPEMPAGRSTAASSAANPARANVGRVNPPRRNRAAPEAKRRRETVILSEAERRPIVQVAEHMAATKPGASFSEAARFLLAIGEHVLATRPDAYATLERTPPAGWAALARALATTPTP